MSVAVLWMWWIEGIHPDLWDAMGVALALSGMAVIGDEVQVDSVPMHVSVIDGEAHELAASEAILRESALKPLMDRGLNPVVGFRSEDRLRVASWRSLHVSGENVRGAWRS